MRSLSSCLAAIAFLSACGGGSSNTSGNTSGNASGSTSGAASSGAVSGSGSATAASSGATGIASSGASGGATSGAISGASSGASSGATGNASSGAVSGASSGSASGASGTSGAACVPGVYDGGAPAGGYPADAGVALPPGDCAGDGVCRFTPNGFVGAFGLSANDIWAISGNAVYHYTGAWNLVYGGLSNFVQSDGGILNGPSNFTTIWASADDDVWVGSYDFCGAILHYDGTSWLQVSGDSTNLPCAEGHTFQQSIGFGPDDVWMTADTGPVVHWDGCSWTPSTGAPTGARAIWGLSSSDLWVGGDVQGANFHHWDGMAWTTYTNPDGATQNGIVYGIWGSSSTDVWAVGDDDTDSSWGTLLHWNGVAWSNVTLPAPLPQIGSASVLSSVWGASSTDVWVGGGMQGIVDTGGLLHWDGMHWSVVDLPWVTGGAWNGNTPHGIDYLWGSSATDVYAFGEEGTILHYDGMHWTSQAGVTPNERIGIWSSAANDVWAVSDDLTPEVSGGVALMHYDGHVWNTVSEFNNLDSGMNILRPFSNLTGNSDSDLWVAGYAGAFHWDGTSITYNNNGIMEFNGGPEYPTFYSAFSDTPTNLWIAGQNGILYQGQGVSSTTIGFDCVQNSIAPYYGSGSIFHSIHGLHGGPLYVVGDSHDVGNVHYDSILIGDTGGGLRTNCAGNCCEEGFTDISFVDPAAADGGGVGPAEFFAVFVVPTVPGGSTAQDVWIGGYQDTQSGGGLPYVIHSTDQQTWVQVPVPDVGVTEISGIWGTSDTDIWFVGKDFADGQGWLLHWDGMSISYVQRSDPGAEGNYDQIWGTSANDVWAAGDGNTMVHFSGL